MTPKKITPQISELKTDLVMFKREAEIRLDVQQSSINGMAALVKTVDTLIERLDALAEVNKRRPNGVNPK